MERRVENLAGAVPAAPETDRFEVLLTAAEAYPALERAFLNAQHTISGSFRIFDLSTRLRSDEARAIGDDWFDLLVHTLNRDVTIRMTVSDFDPIGGAELHRSCWRTRRSFVAAQELARAGRLEIVSALHSGRAGWGARIALWPGALGKLRGVLVELNELSEMARRRFLSEAPGVAELTCTRDGKIAPRLCLPHLTPATHHQKIAVFDRRTLYVGGLDLNERRYDTPKHRRAPDRTWHDVQALVEGPVVEAAQAHLDTFLDVVAGRRPPEPAARGFLRTMSRPARRAPFRLSPRPIVTEIEQAHFDHLERAEQLIYLETQFFRHLPLARALARRARATPELKLILLLPAAPEEVAFENSSGLDVRFGEHLQTRCLSVLRQGFGRDRMLVLAPVQPRPARPGEDLSAAQAEERREMLERAPIVYVHSKVSIFDDHAAILSSANLNGRSFRWDTEAGLDLRSKAHVNALRRRVMAHWLPADAPDSALAPRTAFDYWRLLADANSAREPARRQGFIVHYDSEPARRIAMNVPGVPEEMV